jgi:hypothetical protein
MRGLRRVGVAMLLVLCAGFAGASTNTSEITDIWWNPAESGWGVNIVLQNDVAFMTFFVYDAAQNAVWFTSDIHYQGINGAGALVWTGALYATKGPWFGGQFRPANVSDRQAGNVSFTLSSLNQATLTYSVDGSTVTKSLQRQTWTNENYTGSYAGGWSIRTSQCNPSSLNGIDEEAGVISVSQNGSNTSIVASNGTGTCTFAGTYTQAGKLGQVNGSYTCPNGTNGTFAIFEMTPTISGFTGRVTGQNQYCQWSGYFGGINRAQ